MSERVSVFVNGDNLFAFQKNSFWIDPKELLSWIAEEFGAISDAYYYLSYTAENEKQMNYIRALSHFGYITRPKLGKKHELEPEFNGYEVEYEFEKANLDVDIACDMLSTQSAYDRAILVSPSKDLVRPIELIKMKGKLVTAVATKNFTTHEIMNVVVLNFYELHNLRNRIMRKENSDRRK